MPRRLGEFLFVFLYPQATLDTPAQPSISRPPRGHESGPERGPALHPLCSGPCGLG